MGYKPFFSSSTVLFCCTLNCFPLMVFFFSLLMFFVVVVPASALVCALVRTQRAQNLHLVSRLKRSGPRTETTCLYGYYLCLCFVESNLICNRKIAYGQEWHGTSFVVISHPSISFKVNKQPTKVICQIMRRL